MSKIVCRAIEADQHPIYISYGQTSNAVQGRKRAIACNRRKLTARLSATDDCSVVCACMDSEKRNSVSHDSKAEPRNKRLTYIV